MRTAIHCIYYLTCKADDCEECDAYEPDYPTNRYEEGFDDD